MGKVNIPYYAARNGKGYWQPTQRMKAKGFAARSLGRDGPEAWAEAWRLYEDWTKVKKGITIAGTVKAYPLGSMGYAWERYRRTDAWREKKPRTREEWDSVWLRWIEPIFGDVDPNTIEVENFEALRSKALTMVSLHHAHRVTKIWRAFWKVMAAMRVCVRDADPSNAVRNKVPKGRTQTWKEVEVALIVKRAWRDGYRGLAALLMVAWDTQFQPGDCRSLTLGMRMKDGRGTFFDTSRGKTGKAVLGTISRRTLKVLDAYVADLGFELHNDAPIFRNRSGRPYSRAAMGDDFRTVRAAVFPGEDRKIMDMRRSGAIEAVAGEANPAAMAAKMGNSIDQNRKLQETYLPKRAATVRLADEARRRGRRVLKENE